MPIQVTPREANGFENLFGDSIGIKNVGNRLSDPANQHLALRDLGIRISGTIFTISFKESGFAYADPSHDRKALEPHKTSKNFTVNVSLQLEPLYPLSIVVAFEPFVEECVNFFGYVTVNTPSREKRFIPLTGRGTAALEGRLNDAHAGFVTGGACASFQNRCAFILAVAAAAGVGTAGLSQIGQEMFKINECYHGRDEILDYTLYCSQTQFRDRISYTEFMMQSYPNSSDRSPVLSHVAEKNCLPQIYYNSVLLKLSPSEFQEDRERALNMSSLSAQSVKRLFSVEDGVQMLISKGSHTVLPQPDKWNIQDSQGFNVQARPGDDFISTAAKVVSIPELLKHINSQNAEQQAIALNELGIELNDCELKIVFHESAASQNFGTAPAADNIRSASLALSFKHELKLPFGISLEQKGFISDGVNFWGAVNVASEHFVPLPGRGTVSLEPAGATLSSQLGPVYSGAASSFVTRCALALSIVKCFGASNDQLHQLREMLCNLDFGLHNKSDMICYAVECLKNSKRSMPSYTSFLSFIYDQKSWSPNLTHLLKHGSPDKVYFASVTQHLTVEELQTDQKNSEASVGAPISGNSSQTDLASILGLTFFPYRARLGKDLVTSEGRTKKLVEVFENFSSARNLEDQISNFDVKIENGMFRVTFCESGDPYSDQSGNRTQTVCNVRSSATIEISLPETNQGKKYKLMEVSLKPFLEDHANYVGMLNVVNIEGDKRSIPLVGRGTVAFEGKDSGDNHAGLATGPGCAGFQNRSAVVLGAAFAVGLDEAKIRQIYYMLKYVNDCFHGRGGSLDYIVYCVTTSSKNRKSFFEFTKENVPEAEWNCLMKSVSESGKIGEKTLEKVLGKLTPEEQEEDLNALDTGKHDYHHDHSEEKQEQLKFTEIGGGRAMHNLEVKKSAQRKISEDKHVHFRVNPVELIDLEPKVDGYGDQKLYKSEITATVDSGGKHNELVSSSLASSSPSQNEPKLRNYADLNHAFSETKDKESKANVPDVKKVAEIDLSKRNEGLLETISKHLNPKSIKVRPRMGIFFKNFLGQSFTMYDVVTSFRKKQSEGLSMLGISIDRNSKTFNIIFREEGKPYAEPSGNKSKLGNVRVMEVSYSVRLANIPPEELDVNVSLVAFENDGVNYLGRITFHSSLNEYRYIPLVGRGTVALEGKGSNDALCTVCITGQSATFQQRIAFCFAILASCGGTSQDLDDLSVALKPINDHYHGRDELFYYTLQCSKNAASSVPSYFKFMSHLYPQELNRPTNLYSMAKFGTPSKEYYAQLIDEMSREEIQQDQRTY